MAGVAQPELASRMRLFKSMTAVFLTHVVFVYGDVM